MIHTGYNPLLVALSLLIAVFASYTALDLGERTRGATAMARWAWVAAAAVAMGGGIWSMHFVGMLAFEMGMPAAYDLGLTALSLLIALCATGAAFAWVSRRGARRRDTWIGGPLLGFGIAAMHYTGMAAMRVPGNIAYDAAVAAASVAIAVTAATVALWLTFRHNSIAQKLLAGAVMGFAVAGMHYTGMAAATFTATQAGASHVHVAGTVVGQQNMALSITGATFLILFLAVLAGSLDQQRIARDLQASEERFRAAIKAVRGVLWTNDAEGRMLGEQSGWAALTGQTQAQYKGYGWAEAVHPDDRQGSVESWKKTVERRETYVFEHRIAAHDGTWRNCAIRAVPILAADGRVREWVGVHTDITEQRKAEADLRDTNEELQRYAYIVSHDLRAPLVNIQGFAGELDALRLDVGDALRAHPEASRIDAEFRESLGFIKTAVGRMDGLIAAILKVAREGHRTFRPEALDMTVLIQKLADVQHHQAERSGTTIAIAPDLPGLVADRSAVEQVFGNLIDNALKYLDPARPGRIAVRAEAVGRRWLRYSVEDNGRGIAERDLARVFELFARSGAPDRPGDGIGLAHVKTLLRSIGGRIEVRSTLGQGTTFIVTLPRDGAAPAGTATA